MIDEASGQERVTPWRGRWARIVLVVGIAVALSPLLSHVPREQVLVFRPRASIAKLDASWTADGDSRATGGVTLNLSAPVREVVHTVSLANGRYTLAIHIDQPQSEAQGPDDVPEPVDTTVIRQVTLSGGETVIGL